MANGRTFNADIKAWAAQFPGKMDALARQTSQQVSENVIASTPVDTGFLRSSWQPSIGAPEAAKGAPGAQSQAANAVALTVARMKAGQVYYLTNNANYAKHVEFGTSKMSGRFMVTDNVKRWPFVVESVAKDLGLK